VHLAHGYRAALSASPTVGITNGIGWLASDPSYALFSQAQQALTQGLKQPLPGSTQLRNWRSYR
jgi:hypothetical protein